MTEFPTSERAVARAEFRAALPHHDDPLGALVARGESTSVPADRELADLPRGHGRRSSQKARLRIRRPQGRGSVHLLSPRASRKEVERLLRQRRRPARAAAAASPRSRSRSPRSLIGALAVAGFVFAATIPGLTGQSLTAEAGSAMRATQAETAANQGAGLISTLSGAGAVQSLEVVASSDDVAERDGFEAFTVSQQYSAYSLSSVPCSVSSDDSLRWPLAMGCTISGPYGYRVDPSYGGTAFHAGVDLVPGRGVPVLAAAPGVIVAVEHDSWGYGTHVIISHPQLGITTVYGHMLVDSVGDLQVGQEVAIGDVVGNVGSTGKSTGAHLHFEIRVSDGTAAGYTTVDPVVWMPEHIR